MHESVRFLIQHLFHTSIGVIVQNNFKRMRSFQKMRTNLFHVVFTGVIAGGVVGLAFAIMLVALMVYRMKKKDEGSYALDEHKHPNGGYQKPQRQEEFLA